MRGGIISMNFIEWHELRHGIKPTDTLVVCVYIHTHIYIYTPFFFPNLGRMHPVDFHRFQVF